MARRKILWKPKESEPAPVIKMTQVPGVSGSTQEAPVRHPVTQAPVVEGGDGKFRRLKSSINKGSNKYRELEAPDRDVFINWWNANQRLVEKDDPVCQRLVDEINRNHFSTQDHPLSAAQCAGFFSHLARLARTDATHRQRRILSAQKRGSFTEYPLFSNELINQVNENYLRERDDEAQRRHDHARLRQLRQANPRARVRATETTVDSTVQPVVRSEVPQRPQPQVNLQPVDIDTILSGEFEIA